MKYYLARGYIGDDEPTLFEVTPTPEDLAAFRQREYWTWVDLHGRHGLTVVRPINKITRTRMFLEWGMYSIECELKDATFKKLLKKRPIP